MKAIVMNRIGDAGVLAYVDRPEAVIVSKTAGFSDEVLSSPAEPPANCCFCREAQGGRIGASLRCEAAPRPLARRDFSTGICGVTGSL